MSRFCTVQTQFKDQDSLLRALIEIGGWTLEQIEIHAEPQNLFGYQNDARPEVAHIIIRKRYVGGSSNDIGFIKSSDGTFEAIISEFDRRRYDSRFMAKLKGSYAYHQIDKQMRHKGRKVSREMTSDGRQIISVTGYR